MRQAVHGGCSEYLDRLLRLFCTSRQAGRNVLYILKRMSRPYLQTSLALVLYLGPGFGRCSVQLYRLWRLSCFSRQIWETVCIYRHDLAAAHSISSLAVEAVLYLQTGFGGCSGSFGRFLLLFCTSRQAEAAKMILLDRQLYLFHIFQTG